MADKKNPLPDISGVFNIDESKIPKTIIDKPKETGSAKKTGGILLPDEKPAETKKREKQQRAEVKTKKKEAKRKAMRSRILLAGAALVVVLALALAIRAAVLDHKKPTVALTQVSRETLTAHYDADGSILMQATDEYTASYYAVFVENDYDVYGLQKGQRANVQLNDEVAVSGVVSDIRKEESDSAVISWLISVFSDGSYSTASNYTVFIALDESSYIEENAPVHVTVTTGIAENVLTVPSEAIYKEDAQHYVWVYKSWGKKLLRKDVSVGLETDGRIEIRSGLSEDDFVVTDVLGDNTELYDKVKVKTVPAAQADSEGAQGS